MAAVITDASEGVELGGYKFHITKGDHDVTQDMLGSYPDRKISEIEAVIPYCSNDGGDLTAPLNSLFEVFSTIESTDVLSSQFNVRFTSENKELGSRGYLTVFSEYPFITFDKAPALLLPIGRGERTNVMKEASFLELLFAGHLVSALYIIKKNEAKVLEKSEIREERLHYFYDEERLTYGSPRRWADFDKDVSDAIKRDFVQRSYVLGDIDIYGNEERVSVLSQVGAFSWLK